MDILDILLQGPQGNFVPPSSGQSFNAARRGSGDNIQLDQLFGPGSDLHRAIPGLLNSELSQIPPQDQALSDFEEALQEKRRSPKGTTDHKRGGSYSGSWTTPEDRMTPQDRKKRTDYREQYGDVTPYLQGEEEIDRVARWDKLQAPGDIADLKGDSPIPEDWLLRNGRPRWNSEIDIETALSPDAWDKLKELQYKSPKSGGNRYPPEQFYEKLGVITKDTKKLRSQKKKDNEESLKLFEKSKSLSQQAEQARQGRLGLEAQQWQELADKTNADPHRKKVLGEPMSYDIITGEDIRKQFKKRYKDKKAYEQAALKAGITEASGYTYEQTYSRLLKEWEGDVESVGLFGTDRINDSGWSKETWDRYKELEDQDNKWGDSVPRAQYQEWMAYKAAANKMKYKGPDDIRSQMNREDESTSKRLWKGLAEGIYSKGKQFGEKHPWGIGRGGADRYIPDPIEATDFSKQQAEHDAAVKEFEESLAEKKQESLTSGGSTVLYQQLAEHGIKPVSQGGGYNLDVYDAKTDTWVTKNFDAGEGRDEILGTFFDQNPMLQVTSPDASSSDLESLLDQGLIKKGNPNAPEGVSGTFLNDNNFNKVEGGVQINQAVNQVNARYNSNPNNQQQGPINFFAKMVAQTQGEISDIKEKIAKLDREAQKILDRKPHWLELVAIMLAELGGSYNGRPGVGMQMLWKLKEMQKQDYKDARASQKDYYTQMMQLNQQAMTQATKAFEVGEEQYSRGITRTKDAIALDKPRKDEWTKWQENIKSETTKVEKRVEKVTGQVYTGERAKGMNIYSGKQGPDVTLTEDFVEYHQWVNLAGHLKKEELKTMASVSEVYEKTGQRLSETVIKDIAEINEMMNFYENFLQEYATGHQFSRESLENGTQSVPINLPLDMPQIYNWDGQWPDPVTKEVQAKDSTGEPRTKTNNLGDEVPVMVKVRGVDIPKGKIINGLEGLTALAQKVYSYRKTPYWNQYLANIQKLISHQMEFYYGVKP